MKKYFDPILRWWWLIAACLVAAAVSSYLSVSRQPPIYEVRASLIVGSSIQDPNPSSGEFYLEQQLAAAYANVGSRQIAEPTMKALNLPALPQYNIRPVTNTPLVEVIVTDTNPTRAQAVANELADQLVKSSPSGTSQQESNRRAFVNQQLDQLQEKIKQNDADIIAAQQRLAEANNARQIEDLQNLIEALEQKQISMQTTYTDLLANTQQGAVNNLTILQYAPLPSRPVGPNKALYVLIASALGLVVSTAAAYAIELLDTRIKRSEEIAEILGVPILGHVQTIPRDHNPFLYTLRNPRSPITDSFRNIRTNLEFMGVNQPLRKILVTGGYPSDGKSTIAANLALIIAQADKRVVLIETDMRRPKLLAAFGVDEAPGVSDACVGKVRLEKALIPLDRLMAGSTDNSGTETPGLEAGQFQLLPAGTIPPNPAELLSSARFEQILAELADQTDVVIIDSPPLFLPDASVLLNKVDGVIVVFQPNRTRRNVVNMVQEQIQRSGARLLGVTLNRSAGQPYYYDYRHERETQAQPLSRAQLPVIRSRMGIPKIARKQ